jgi:hypothetical protein
MVITRSTVDDFIKAFNKMQTFFQVFLKGKDAYITLNFKEQMKSSRIVWSADIEPRRSPAKVARGDVGNRQTRNHWQYALDLVTRIQLGHAFLPMPRTQDGVTVIGGNVDLEGGRATLACMNGEINASR